MDSLPSATCNSELVQEVISSLYALLSSLPRGRFYGQADRAGMENIEQRGNSLILLSSINHLHIICSVRKLCINQRLGIPTVAAPGPSVNVRSVDDQKWWLGAWWLKRLGNSSRGLSRDLKWHIDIAKVVAIVFLKVFENFEGNCDMQSRKRRLRYGMELKVNLNWAFSFTNLYVSGIAFCQSLWVINHFMHQIFSFFLYSE